MLKAAFINQGREPGIARVYDEATKTAISALFDFSSAVFTKEDVLADRLSDMEVLFSTWGFPVMSDEEIAIHLPKLKVVSYGLQLVAYQTLLDEFGGQTVVRDDIFIQFSLIENRDAGVIGHDKDRWHILSILSSDSRDCLSRKEMNTYDPVIVPVFYYMCQPFGEQHAEKVNGGFPFELQGTVPLRESVDKTEQSDLYRAFV